MPTAFGLDLESILHGELDNCGDLRTGFWVRHCGGCGGYVEVVGFHVVFLIEWFAGESDEGGIVVERGFELFGQNARSLTHCVVYA